MRVATAADIPALTDFVAALFSEESVQAVSQTKIAGMVRRCAFDDGAIVGIIGSGGTIEASLALELDQLDYSDSDYLAVRWLGTAPVYRHTNHGGLMMNFLEWAQGAVSRQAGYPVPLFFGILTLRDLGPKMRLYSRSAPQVGASYCVGLDVPAAVTQRRVGDDPFGRHQRFLKAKRRERRRLGSKLASRSAAASPGET